MKYNIKENLKRYSYSIERLNFVYKLDEEGGN